MKTSIWSKLVLTVAALGVMTACCNKECKKTEMKEFTKKYTNADFYKDGVFQQDVAFKAYKEMFEFYDVPFTEALEKDMWVTDFGLGDFENVGMGGIFWVNDAEHGYFGHEIYLLPNQMIVEHAHVSTKFPAKFESWRVVKGWCYNFNAVGEPSPNCPALPESQKGNITALNFVRQDIDQVVHLAAPESFHFILAGDNGAIVAEYASYHDGAGLRFTNPNAKL